MRREFQVVRGEFAIGAEGIYKTAALLLAFALTLAAHAKPVLGLIMDCHDGDTVKIRTADGRFLRIRLENIDAPEIQQAGGVESRDYLRRLAPLNQPVTVEVSGLDKYHRSLGTVYRNNQNLNLTLVRTGHAWVYRKYCSAPNYLQAEAEAHRHHLGLWSNPSSMAPWIFRHLPKAPKDKRASVIGPG